MGKRSKLGGKSKGVTFLWINDIPVEVKIALKVIAKEEGFPTLSGFLKWRTHKLIESMWRKHGKAIQAAMKEHWEDEEKPVK